MITANDVQFTGFCAHVDGTYVGDELWFKAKKNYFFDSSTEEAEITGFSSHRDLFEDWMAYEIIDGCMQHMMYLNTQAEYEIENMFPIDFNNYLHPERLQRRLEAYRAIYDATNLLYDKLKIAQMAINMMLYRQQESELSSENW